MRDYFRGLATIPIVNCILVIVILALHVVVHTLSIEDTRTATLVSSDVSDVTTVEAGASRLSQ